MRARLPLLLALLLGIFGAGLAPRGLAAETRRPVLIVLREQADLRPARGLLKKEERGRAVLERLRQAAERGQPQIKALLRARGLEGRSLLSVNAIAAEVDDQTRALLQRHPAVAQVLDDRPRQVLEPLLPQSPDAAQSAEATSAVEWGIVDINADDVWSTYGVTGTGVVVAGNDTGIDWDHPALQPHYRGWNGGVATHDYNWFDGIHAPDGFTPNPLTCDYDEPVPCDDQGHGTHTAGTMVGDDAAGNRIGVAPGATWIGCRNMDRSGNGTISSYLECFDFFLAPTDRQGNSPQPELAPHIVNNSWGCTPGEGCTVSMLAALEPAVQSLSAAGILVVGSAGNAGPGCGTISQPPAIYSDTFVVGAYDFAGTIGNFSSRGPISYGGVSRVGPELTAPGVDVRSSYTNGTYASLLGTSMAAPHVAGAAALLWSARPDLQGHVELTRQILRYTARAKSADVGFGCGTDPAARPNNVFGWGRLDALAAVEEGLTTGALTVTVIQGWDGTPLADLEVAIEGDYDLRLSTSAVGQVATPLPAGTYQVMVSSGVAQRQAVVTIAADTPTAITLAFAHQTYVPLLRRG